MIVYPEGHRFKGEGTLKLKTGVMEVAYNLKTPCQIVLSKGKENLMDEINLTIHKQALITVYVSDVLDPTKFETKEAWFEYVNEQWKDSCEKLEKGEIHVFDCANFTVKGEALTSYQADVNADSDNTPDTEVVHDGYFSESEFRSAPYFDLQIDGINLLDTNFGG